MLSRLYEGRITHHRNEPAHSFSYPVWYAYLHLDEIDTFCRTSRWLSHEHFNFLAFYREDYLPGGDSLKDEVCALLQQHRGRTFNGDIYLLTTLRQLGYAMNPISLYYCFETGTSQPVHIIAEVHNTPWGERYTYVLDADQAAQSKAFHVSPFMPMNLVYQFHLPTPAASLNVGIQLTQADQPVFGAHLALREQPVTQENLHRLLIQHGWQSVKTITRIYFQALRLWMKNAKFFAHPKRMQPKRT